MRKLLAFSGAALLAVSTAHADIKIGLVTSSSGPAAATGLPLIKGIEAALKHADTIGSEKLIVIRLDDASDPSNAAKNARKLIEQDQVDILMGSSTAPSSIAMAAVANEMKVPMIALAPITAPKADRTENWAICVIQPPPLIVKTIADRMAKDGAKNVAFIGFSDPWGDLVYNGAKAQESNNGLKIITNERYGRSDTTVTGQVLKLLAQRPDAVLLGGSGTPGALPALALAERGFKGQVYGTAPLVNPDFVRIGGNSVEGIKVSTGPVVVADQLPDGHFSKSISRAFRDAYKAANGEFPPDGISAYAFDAWLILLEASKRALSEAKPGTAQFRSALRDALFSTRDLKGTHAVYNFQPGQIYGADERGFVIVKLKGGVWTYEP
jgi:branched-chain amino acid transport system substrate-binding protein